MIDYKVKLLIKKYVERLYYPIYIYNLFHNLGKIKVRGKGNKLFNLGACLIKHANITINGNNNVINFGRFSRINGFYVDIFGDDNQILIGDSSILLETSVSFEGSGNQFQIGPHTSIHGPSHFTIAEGTKIIIGEDCMLSHRVEFRTGDSHSIVNLSGERINPSKDILIGAHVWIGYNVLILKGGVVSNNSIVAASSLVNKEFSVPNIIIGGNPGRILKNGIDWKRELTK